MIGDNRGESEMSEAKELANRLSKAAQSGDRLNWRQAREDIHRAHDAAETEADRVLCIGLHKSIMDAVERQGLVKEDKMEEFREARRKDYILFLIKEAIVGRTDGIISPDKLAAVTRRGVAAGRMTADDEFHRLAVAGDTMLMPTQREAGGVGAWIASRFK